MEQNETRILLRDIPQEVTRPAAMDTFHYTVGLTSLSRSNKFSMMTGILVSVENKRAILTAYHVIEELFKNNHINVILELRNSAPATIHTRDCHKFRIPSHGVKVKDPELGPDLGLLVFPPNFMNSIVATKSTYGLARYRDSMIQEAGAGIVSDTAFYIMTGYPDEGKTSENKVEVSGKTINHNQTDHLFLFSALGAPENPRIVNEFDYISLPLEGEEGLSVIRDVPIAEHLKPTPPQRSWGGMSGGGVWRAGIWKDQETGEIRRRPPQLYGVMFYEHRRKDTNGVERPYEIKAHGPISIYKHAFEVIVRSINT